MLRNHCPFGEHLFHIEAETDAAIIFRLHTRHNASDLNIFAFPVVRQDIGQAPLRKCGSPKETYSQTKQSH